MTVASFLNNRNVVAISVLIAIMGVFLSIIVGGIFNIAIIDADKEWDKALKFNDENAAEFPYSIKTQQGNLYATGEIKAVSELVSNENLPGKYLSIREIMEEYREHVETYECGYTDSNGDYHPRTCTRTYWSWDFVGSKTSTVEQISLLGQTMNADMIPWTDTSLFSSNYEAEDLAESKQQDTLFGKEKRYLATGHNKRSHFNVIRVGFTGSFGFTSDQDGLRYNADLNGPKSGKLKVTKWLVVGLMIISSVAGAIYFGYYNYEHYDQYF